MQNAEFIKTESIARQKTGIASAATGMANDTEDTRKRKSFDPRFDLDADEESPASDVESDPIDRRRREKEKHRKKERHTAWER